MISESKLGIGPMSRQIIESVFSYSAKKKAPLMLISSFNQINYLGGYVTNNNNYAQTVDFLRKKYPDSEVYICRDHCGPGFSSDITMDNLNEAMQYDLDSGFDLMHIDFSKYSQNLDEILNVSKNAIEFIKSKNPDTKFEIGTDENTGNDFRTPDQVNKIADYFKEICDPVFFVIQTGSLIKEIEQVGHFDSDYVKNVLPIINQKNMLIKEHNADYLGTQELQKRQGLVNAVNNAPQFGVLQTTFTIHKALQYGMNITDFLNTSYESKKWVKWLYKSNAENKFLCSVIAGHYNFETDTYRKLVEGISKHEDFGKNLEAEVHKLIEHYLTSLS
jgi:tagatose-1,6-bisphosphate aldolase non-catalytic subunit AgaZ/GatZ